MTDDILTRSVFDEQFRDEYEYNIPVTQGVINCSGCNFTVIGEYKSHWGDIYEKQNLGYLSQEATITIVNPDHHAPTAFVSLLFDKYMECREEQFKDMQVPTIRVIAYPRDTTTPANIHSGYAHDLAEAVPEAYFIHNSTNDFLSKQSLWKPHECFLSQAIKGGQVAPWGLSVQKIQSRRENLVALDDFLNSNILSNKPKVRDCFKWFVGTLCNPEQLSTPIKSDRALPAAYVGQRSLNAGD